MANVFLIPIVERSGKAITFIVDINCNNVRVYVVRGNRQLKRKCC